MTNTILKNESPLPEELFSIIIGFAYARDLDWLNYYVQTLLLKCRFGPIPAFLNRIFDGNRVVWSNVLDGNLTFRITKILSHRSMILLVNDLNWTAMKYSSCRMISDFAEENHKCEVIRALSQKYKRECMMWRLMTILPSIGRNEFKKTSWYKFMWLRTERRKSEYPLCSFIEPPLVFISPPSVSV